MPRIMPVAMIMIMIVTVIVVVTVRMTVIVIVTVVVMALPGRVAEAARRPPMLITLDFRFALTAAADCAHDSPLR
jgi:hypothetical protein